MKIYTRSGDDGTTGVFGGERVSKTDDRIRLLGEIDELNAALGLARLNPGDEPLNRHLERLQSCLFDLGAEVATPRDSQYFCESIQQGEIDELERDMDRMTDQLPALRNFILPGGTPLAAHLHHARTVCRRCERSAIAASDSLQLRPNLPQFLNRLSDWLFTAARYANHLSGIEDVPWKKRS